MINQGLQKIMSRHHYPQVVFGRSVSRYINSLPSKPSRLIDCPCGNGETAWHLAETLGVHIDAVDIDEQSIRRAQSNLRHPLITFKIGDIESVLRSGAQAGVFCLINSLFLFKDAEALLGLLQGFIKKNEAELVLVIPNTAGKNFTWFQQAHPGENKLLIHERDIHSFFEKRGFIVNKVAPLAYAHHFNRKDLRLFSICSPLYRGVLNFVQKALRIGKPNYFLIALSAN